MKKENIIPLLSLFLSMIRDVFILFFVALFVIAGKIFIYTTKLGMLIIPKSIYKGRDKA